MHRRIYLVALFVLVGALLPLKRAHAILEIGTDLMFSTNISNFTVASHSYIFLSFDERTFAFGPIFQFERPWDTVNDMIIGVGVKYEMKHFFIELDGGYLTRNLDHFWGKSTGKGYAGILSFGWGFGHFRLAIPISVKRITSVLNPRFQVEVLPFFGVRVLL